MEGDLDIRLRNTDIGVAVVERSQVQLLERTTVDPSAGRRWQGGEVGDERRVHEPWQAFRDVELESLLLVNELVLSNGRLELGEGDNGGSIVESSDEDGGTLDGLVLVYDVLDLTELNALTTKLDLTILSATVDDVSIGTEHGNISSAVDTLSGDEEVGDERLLGLFRLVEVSAGELSTANEELSFDTNGGRT